MNPDYITPDYCISCAYFQSTKGHYGKCSVLPEKPAYDGAKAGTGCICWRIKTDLISLLPVQEEKPRIKSLAVLYNQQAKKKYMDKRSSLPRSVTSNLSGARSRYYKHRYNSEIIERVLTLHLQGLKVEGIQAELGKLNMRIPCRRTIRECVKKLLGSQCWDTGSPAIICPHCRGVCVKNGLSHGTKQRWKCRKCKKNIQLISRMYDSSAMLRVPEFQP